MLSPNTLTLPWWKRVTAYQIYPRSFYDSNGDGIGDIQGIIDKLGYLHDLGIGLIWISPIYQSPNDDYGYDISDFREIHPDYGTLEDMDRLIAAAHEYDIRIIMDLVLNHTSDEHKWFIESRASRTNAKRDWYIWRDGSAPTLENPTNEPNNWESIFHGSAWEYDSSTGQYYMHLFSRKQPDLNWDNQEVREALYTMISWWLERGIDGFRVDAISHIKKLHGLPSIPNPKGAKYIPSFDYHMNVKGIEDHLKELHNKTFAHYKNIFTVGEANGVEAEEAETWVAEKGIDDDDTSGGFFNTIFQFEHMRIWSHENPKFDLVKFKGILTRWQEALEGRGWNSLYLENHDQSRSINTFGNLNYWYGSATALATCYLLMKGTPFIYQGQEIGMINHVFTSPDEFIDVSARSLIQKMRVEGSTDSQIMDLLNIESRDHARLPIQWNDDKYGGFSRAKPWFSIASDCSINVAQQQGDPLSIWNYYKRLINLRKSHDCLIVGRYELLLNDDPCIYAYKRFTTDFTFTIITNLSPRYVVVELDITTLGDLILDNQNTRNEVVGTTKEVAPYAAYIFKRRNMS